MGGMLWLNSWKLEHSIQAMAARVLDAILCKIVEAGECANNNLVDISQYCANMAHHVSIQGY